MTVSARELLSRVHPGSPAIDADTIDGLRLLEDDDEPSVIGELVDLFLATVPPRLAAVDAALAAGDRTALGKVAHSLKSSSANLGALGMSDLCERLEGVRHVPADHELPALIALLHDEFTVVTAALRAITTRPSA